MKEESEVLRYIRLYYVWWRMSMIVSIFVFVVCIVFLWRERCGAQSVNEWVRKRDGHTLWRNVSILPFYNKYSNTNVQIPPKIVVNLSVESRHYMLLDTLKKCNAQQFIKGVLYTYSNLCVASTYIPPYVLLFVRWVMPNYSYTAPNSVKYITVCKYSRTKKFIHLFLS